MTPASWARFLTAGAVVAACISGCGVPTQVDPEPLPNDVVGTPFAPGESTPAP